MFQSWLFWSFLAVVFWGVGQVMAKGGLAYFSPLTYNIVSTLLGFPVFTAYALYLGVDFSRFGLGDFLILIFIVSTYLLYFYAISLADISLSGTILSAYPLSTIFFSVIFLSERLSSLQLLGALAIIFGVVLMGFPEKTNHRASGRWFWLAISATTLIGFADFLAKSLINRVGVANYLFFYSLAFLPGLLLTFWRDRKGRVWPRLPLKLTIFSLIGAGLIGWGNIPFFMAFATGPASLVSPVVSSNTVITVILAMVFLRERVRPIQALGVLLTILGITFIGI